MRFRNDLNPSLFDDIPTLDLSEDRDPEGLQFWGEDGGRLDRFIAGQDEDGEDDSSSDESEHDDDEDEEEMDHTRTNIKSRSRDLFDLPGHV